MASIEVRSLHKTYGKTVALGGIDLTVEEGRILGLIGPNGAGKSTALLVQTSIRRTSKVGELSKGTMTQLHLALVMAIDAKLLLLGEPMLGLDILYRKQFYDSLLHDYFDRSRTIIVTTHQVEEIQQSSPMSCSWIAAAWCLIAAWMRMRRGPFLWAILPPLALCLAEKIVFDRSCFSTMLANRLAG